MTTSISSLRRNWAALACFVPFSVKAIWVTLRASAQQMAMRSVPFGEPHAAGSSPDALRGLVECRPDPLMDVVVHIAAEGDPGCRPGQNFGLSTAAGGEEVSGKAADLEIDGVTCQI